MSISDEDLALRLARAYHWEHAAPTWDTMAESKEDWLKVLARARHELLTPDMQMPPFPGSPCPLQPGDIVSVRGVVKIAPPTPGAGVHVLLDEGCVTALVTPRTVTLIERPAPIEPDWQPGDVAKSGGPKGDGTLYRYWPHDGDMFAPWLSIHSNRDIERWVTRGQIPGTLTLCDIVPREAG